MANPEPLIHEPQKPIPAKQQGVTTRARSAPVFDPKDRFFPQGLLESFDEKAPPASAPAPAPLAKARMREWSIALLALLALALVAWLGARWMRSVAPPAAQAGVTSPSVATPIRAAPREPEAAPASSPPAPARTDAQAAHVPSAVVAIPRTGSGATVTPAVTHTHAAHVAPAAPVAPPAPAKAEEKPAPVAPDPNCAQAIAALGLCGTPHERKGP